MTYRETDCIIPSDTFYINLHELTSHVVKIECKLHYVTHLIDFYILRMLMQNLKGWAIIGLIVAVLLTIVIVTIYSSTNSPGQSSPDNRVHNGGGHNMTMST